MNGPSKKERAAEYLTVLVIGALFFVGGTLLGLSVGVLLVILAITAIATVAVFVLS
ncbi:MAG: hypothetical protein IPK93_05945 [Solirubrobacterales bacterium]|nr:hypothetical protein [Solirubrobacterales bacterium]